MNKKVKAYVDNQYLMFLSKIDAQNKIINELTSKLYDVGRSDYLLHPIWKALHIFQDFKNKVESSHTIVKECKKCGHPTVHLVGNAPLLTRCLNCGTVWETTTKTVTEVKDISKKK
jgi:ribosomal protein S27E